MIAAFREGHDIHTATAAKIYHEDIADVTSTQRKKAKQANFGIIYGITAYGLTQRMEIDNREAKQLIEDYFVTFPKVHEYMEKAKQSATLRMVPYVVLPNAMPSTLLYKALRQTSLRLP